MSRMLSLTDRVEELVHARDLADGETPVLLMVSGGSDSTALAYLACELHKRGALGELAMLHVNHHIRGAASDGDAAFVQKLADHLGIPLFMCDIDVPGIVSRNGGNTEAVARDERYQAAAEALESLCRHAGYITDDGRVFTAHTADDRVENFYMRSIVGCGPGGFRSMDYLSHAHGFALCRPLLHASREELRAYLAEVPDAVTDDEGALWREDATNLDTDHFRAFVRHEIIPQAKRRNPRLLESLTRTMDLIADEDDMLDGQARELLVHLGTPLGDHLPDGVVLAPELAEKPLPMQRRVVAKLLGLMLPRSERLESASVQACLDALGTPGAVANIQGNLAVSYNKHGLRIEPMAAFRARRKK